MHQVENTAPSKPDSQDVANVTKPENLSDREIDSTTQTTNINKTSDRKKKHKKKKDYSNYKKTSVFLRKDLYKELKKASIDTDKNLQELIEEAVEEWLKRYKKVVTQS